MVPGELEQHLLGLGDLSLRDEGVGLRLDGAQILGAREAGGGADRLHLLLGEERGPGVGVLPQEVLELVLGRAEVAGLPLLAGAVEHPERGLLADGPLRPRRRELGPRQLHEARLRVGDLRPRRADVVPAGSVPVVDPEPSPAGGPEAEERAEDRGELRGLLPDAVGALLLRPLGPLGEEPLGLLEEHAVAADPDRLAEAELMALDLLPAHQGERFDTGGGEEVHGGPDLEPRHGPGEGLPPGHEPGLLREPEEGDGVEDLVDLLDVPVGEDEPGVGPAGAEGGRCRGGGSGRSRGRRGGGRGDARGRSAGCDRDRHEGRVEGSLQGLRRGEGPLQHAEAAHGVRRRRGARTGVRGQQRGEEVDGLGEHAAEDGVGPRDDAAGEAHPHLLGASLHRRPSVEGLEEEETEGEEVGGNAPVLAPGLLGGEVAGVSGREIHGDEAPQREQHLAHAGEADRLGIEPAMAQPRRLEGRQPLRDGGEDPEGPLLVEVAAPEEVGEGGTLGSLGGHEPPGPLLPGVDDGAEAIALDGGRGPDLVEEDVPRHAGRDGVGVEEVEVHGQAEAVPRPGDDHAGTLPERGFHRATADALGNRREIAHGGPEGRAYPPSVGWGRAFSGSDPGVACLGSDPGFRRRGLTPVLVVGV